MAFMVSRLERKSLRTGAKVSALAACRAVKNLGRIGTNIEHDLKLRAV
jgi:hypothetical protein